MTATLELLTGQLPGEYFEILHVMPQVGHVLCGKSFIFLTATTIGDYELGTAATGCSKTSDS